MEQRNTIILHLMGLLLFGLVLFAVNALAGYIDRSFSHTYDLTLVLLLRIPLYTMLVPGTVLLRLDLLVGLFRGDKPKFHWPTLATFGWPYLVFVVVLPVLIYKFPQAGILSSVYHHFAWLLGGHAFVLAGVLCGLGLIWSFKERSI